MRTHVATAFFRMRRVCFLQWASSGIYRRDDSKRLNRLNVIEALIGSDNEYNGGIITQKGKLAWLYV